VSGRAGRAGGEEALKRPSTDGRIETMLYRGHCEPRRGARFVVELFKVDRYAAPLKERFRALKDLTLLDLGPGDQVCLKLGESLTLEPDVAHAFWAEGGAATGESLVNEDRTDNCSIPPLKPPPRSTSTRRRFGTVRDYERL
jgi:D-lyxose ketol-isomerase